MAKKRKMPKRPKLSASLDVFKRWEERAKEVKKHNDALDKAKKAKESILKKYR